MEKKEIAPEELREIKAVDAMCRPFYPSRDVLRKMFTNYEFQIMAITTFGGVLKKAGIEKPEDAWKAVAKMGPKESLLSPLCPLSGFGCPCLHADRPVS